MKIIAVKSKKNNIELHFEDDTTLILSGDVFLKSALRKGDEVDEKRIKALIEEEFFYQAKKKAIQLLSKRLLSEHELKIKLTQKKFDMTIIDKVLNNMKEIGLLDDVNYAKQFFEYSLKRKKDSLKAIKYNLLKKGIHEDIIRQVEIEYDVNYSEKENISMIIDKKLKFLSSQKLDYDKFKSRLFRYLLSKGYDAGLISEVLNDKLSSIRQIEDEIKNEDK